MRMAVAEREEREREKRMISKTGIGRSPSRAHGDRNVNANTSAAASAAAVRDAILDAAVGLISGDSSGTSNTTLGRVSPPSHPRTINPPSSALPPVQAPIQNPAVLSKEMMDIFAKTAAAAISSQKTKSMESTGIATTTSNININRNPKLPAIVSSSILADAASSKDITSSNVVPTPCTSEGTRSVDSQKLPNEVLSTNPPVPASQVVTSSELEAARALMRIPGSVSHSTGESMRGHWELVRPEELKKGSSLAKALPDVVTKSGSMSYDTYKTMAMNLKMTPPQVMRIPDGWDPRKEPVYLVVDPANVASASVPATSSASLVAMNMNMNAASKSPPAV